MLFVLIVVLVCDSMVLGLLLLCGLIEWVFVCMCRKLFSVLNVLLFVVVVLIEVCRFLWVVVGNLV